MTSPPPPPSSSDSGNNHKEAKEEEQKEKDQAPSLRTIESALKLVDSKKESLKKAYDHLHSLTSSSSSSSLLPFSWALLDSHFSALHSSLSRRFLLLLHSYDSNSNSAPPIRPNATSPSSAPPQLLDGKGLRSYVHDSAKDSNFIREEVAGWLGRASRDPGALVLDAVEGIWSFPVKEKKGCVLILEAFVKVKPEEGVKAEVRERARKLGLEWMEKVNLKAGASMELLAFLNLAAGFGLAKEMDVARIVACFVAISGYGSAPALFKEVGLDDSAAASVVEKLIEEEKQLQAIKFICELGLANKFRPVNILTTYLKKLKKHRNRSCKEGKHSVSTKNHIRSKEISALVSAMKLIDEYKLPYPKVDLEKRIEMLEKQKNDELRAPSPDKSFKKQQELEKNQAPLSQNGNKRPRTMVSTGPVLPPRALRSSPLPPVARFPGAQPNVFPHIIAPYARAPTGQYHLSSRVQRHPQSSYVHGALGQYHLPGPYHRPYIPQ